MAVKNEEEDEGKNKTEIAVEICELTRSCSMCANLHQTPFINWYLLLRVDDNADLECIRKQYHKLALQVHPDKNNHSKAETAFKLLSEAYFCLSDEGRRAAFDSKKNTISCTKCNTTTTTFTKNTVISRNTCNYEKSIPTNHHHHHRQSTTSFNPRIYRQTMDLRTKLREEAAVIEKCLTTLSRTEYHTKATIETPVFNPSDYRDKGYPHYRPINYLKLQDFVAVAGLRMGNGHRCLHDTAPTPKNPYPVFQNRPERSPLMSRRCHK